MLIEGLTDRHWALIAKYLCEEADVSDLEEISALLSADPELGKKIDEIQRQLAHRPSGKEVFDNVDAFRKLSGRLKNEGLL